MFEDFVFLTTEKTAPNFFPEILIPPHAASSQGPNRWGSVGSGDGGNGGEGMAAVLSSDLTQCLGVPPCRGLVGTAQAAEQEPGEQSSDFSGLRPCSPGCSPCLRLQRGHSSHGCG